MKSLKYYIGTILLVMLLCSTIPYACSLIEILFIPKNVKVLQQMSLYQWVAIGFVGFYLLRVFLHKNIIWLETFSHELTHIVVAFMFFRKVHSFHVEEGSGVVYTSGQANGMIAPMALAPYCLPIFTYLLVAFRCLINSQGVWAYDIAIGMTISFHVTCFIHQTGKYQTDINQYPLLFSYIFIYTSRLINACIITVAFFPSYNLFSSMWRCIEQIYSNAINFVSLVF